MALEDTRPTVRAFLSIKRDYLDAFPDAAGRVSGDAVLALFGAARDAGHPPPDLATVRLWLVDPTGHVHGATEVSIQAAARCGPLVDGEPACPSCHVHGDQPHTEYCERAR